jgi:hypothetical protein
LAEVTARPRSGIVEHDVDAAGQQVVERGARATIGHVHHVDPGHALEQLAGEMHRGAVAGRCEGHFPRIGLGVGNEFRDRVCRRGDRHRHDVGVVAEQRDWREVSEGVEGQRGE